MTTYKLTLAYDGAPFAGWAAQPELRTVEGELGAALERLLGDPVELSVAGRTDAGVHATGQVASFSAPREAPAELRRALNALTPPEIAVLAAEPAPDGFDARRAARSRTYRYRVLAAPVPSPFERGRSLWWPHPIDRGALDACAEAVVGRHDFTAFTPTQTEHVLFERNVSSCSWLAEKPVPGGAVLAMEIEAPSFMRNQVRVLVGTMLEVGSGRRSAEDFASLLGGAPRERAGETAPAHGLYLTGVRYREGP